MRIIEKGTHIKGGICHGKALCEYVTGLGFLMRGLTQVWGSELSAGMDASISGIAGIGHILTGTGIVLLLLAIRKKAG